ncbi:MAG: type IV pilin protein [Gammaproteobacteria bacterium]|nr:type IV pilin protein [Gammaproteobacteria bacterium]MBQ0840934.1 type IV pilin protein [Gammaproteobacteria bacterium]
MNDSLKHYRVCKPGLNKSSGFTLIELMMVVAIVAILAAVALPSYFDSIRKSRRADAMDALLTLQNSQEKWRANHTTYGAAADIGIAADGTSTSQDGYYTLAAAGNNATAYTLTATATGSQAADAHCAAMILVVSAGNPGGAKGGTNTDCWRN